MKKVYSLVPIQDFSKKWNDEMLFTKYKLTKNEILFIKTNSDGKSLAEYLQNTVPLIIKDLPIAKLMSYQLDDGWNTVSFARPMKNILCLVYGMHIFILLMKLT